MDALDIPELLKIPDPAPYDEDAVAMADFVMTALVRKEPSMLHAEFWNDRGRWFVRDSKKNERCLLKAKSVGEFRAVLARFGFHYMRGQLYGGHTRRIVTQGGRRFDCEIFMSNQGRTGYWIRIYLQATDDSSAQRSETLK